MPSFTKGVAFVPPNRRAWFDSFSVKRSGALAFGEQRRSRDRVPEARIVVARAHDAAIPSPSAPVNFGRGPPPIQDHVLRNQRCGRTWMLGLGRSGVLHRDPDQHVLGSRLRVFDEHVEVAVLVEHAGVEQLVLRVVLAPRAGSSSRDPRTGTAPAGTCRGTSCRSASASSRGRSRAPSRPRRGCPSALASPNSRSFRIGSRPFQSASAKHRTAWSSQMPPIPSSPQW